MHKISLADYTYFVEKYYTEYKFKQLRYGQAFYIHFGIKLENEKDNLFNQVDELKAQETIYKYYLIPEEEDYCVTIS